MTRLLKFLRQEMGAWGMVLVALLVFGASFALFSIPWSIYWVSAFLLLVCLGLYFVYKWTKFRQEESALKRFEDLERELRQVKNDHQSRLADLEEYFLLWTHQIKTPITATRLLLEDEDKNLEDSRMLLKRQTLKIESYTKSALDYIKVSSPDRDMLFSRIKVDDLLRPLFVKYRSLFIHKQITLHYETIEDEVLTETSLAEIMVEQILSNALKYTSQGDIWVTFDSETTTLWIEDNGMGIAASDLPKIFDRGYSGYNGQLNEKSTGIGLFLVRNISERLDIPVQVASSLHEGTRFGLTFNKGDV